jgi:VIT1/CCC1 family predicted Fe2+/Mn2+ transporter
VATSSCAGGQRWYPLYSELDRRLAAASAMPSQILITGVAGLVVGAMSMAAGEYVSVSSQADTEHADLGRESNELSENTT